MAHPPPLRPPPPPPAGGRHHDPRPRSSWHPDKLTVAKVVGLWKPFMALVLGVVTTWGYLETKLDQRIDEAVKTHNTRQGSDPNPPHPEVQNRLKALESLLRAHASHLDGVDKRVEVSEESLRELYWWLVGDKAAQLENDRHKRAQTARDARERFLRYVREGERLEDAYRHALPSAVLGR